MQHFHYRGLWEIGSRGIFGRSCRTKCRNARKSIVSRERMRNALFARLSKNIATAVDNAAVERPTAPRDCKRPRDVTGPMPAGCWGGAPTARSNSRGPSTPLASPPYRPPGIRFPAATAPVWLHRRAASVCCPGAARPRPHGLPIRARAHILLCRRRRHRPRRRFSAPVCSVLVFRDSRVHVAGPRSARSIIVVIFLLLLLFRVRSAYSVVCACVRHARE